MFRFKIFLILVLCCTALTSFVEAIDKERLKTFFSEYDASPEKKKWGWDRLPYAIEKGYPDVAELLILNGDPIDHYPELY